MSALASPGAWLPARRTLTSLRAAVQQCHGCDLYRHATQAVFGEGPRKARMILIGAAKRRQFRGGDHKLFGFRLVRHAG